MVKKTPGKPAVDLKYCKSVVMDALGEANAKGAGIYREHRASIRASSLPICYRDVVLTEWAHKARGRLPTREWSAGSLLFVGIGTAVHAIVQAYLGRARLVYGSWECAHCKRRWLNQVSPGECCGEMPEYVEYAIVHPNPEIGEFGHVDSLFLLPHGLGYIVGEYKTTSEALAASLRKTGPYEKHMLQASSYFEFLEQGYAEVIKRGPSTPEEPRGRIEWRAPAVLPPGGPQGLCIVYIIRDKPRIQHWIPFFRQPVRGQLAELEDRVPKVKRYIRKGVLPTGACTTRADASDEFGTECPWATVCFGTESLKQDTVDNLYKQYKRNKNTPPSKTGGTHGPTQERPEATKGQAPEGAGSARRPGGRHSAVPRRAHRG